MDGLGADLIEPTAFQFEIEAVFLVEGSGTAIFGLVELGTVFTGAAVDIHGLHQRRQAVIGAIIRDGEQLEAAVPGQLVTLLLEELTPGHIASGMLVTNRGGQRHKELRECCHREYQSLFV